MVSGRPLQSEHYNRRTNTQIVQKKSFLKSDKIRARGRCTLRGCHLIAVSRTTGLTCIHRKGLKYLFPFTFYSLPSTHCKQGILSQSVLYCAAPRVHNGYRALWGTHRSSYLTDESLPRVLATVIHPHFHHFFSLNKHFSPFLTSRKLL